MVGAQPGRFAIRVIIQFWMSLGREEIQGQSRLLSRIARPCTLRIQQCAMRFNRRVRVSHEEASEG